MHVHAGYGKLAFFSLLQYITMPKITYMYPGTGKLAYHSILPLRYLEITSTFWKRKAGGHLLSFNYTPKSHTCISWMWKAHVVFTCIQNTAMLKDLIYVHPGSMEVESFPFLQFITTLKIYMHVHPRCGKLTFLSLLQYITMPKNHIHVPWNWNRNDKNEIKFLICHK